MFRTGPLCIIRSISTLYKCNRYLSCQFCWVSAGVVILTTLADQHDKYLLRVYSVEILLIMDSGHIRNMQGTLSNKYGKWCISLAFFIRIYNDARSSECQMYLVFDYLLVQCFLPITIKYLTRFTRICTNIDNIKMDGKEQ